MYGRQLKRICYRRENTSIDISNHNWIKLDPILIQLVKEGKKWTEISSIINVNADTARYHFNRLRKRGKHNIKKGSSKKKWTEAELDLIRLHYTEWGPKKLAENTNRTKRAINSKGFALGLSKRHLWTPLELELITEHYQDWGSKKLAKYMNRTEKAICKKGFQLNLVKKHWR